MKAAKILTMLLVGAAVLGLAKHTASADTPPANFTVSINLDNSEVLPDAPSLVRAFIPTGSASVKCMATMNETTFVDEGAQMFCGQRTSPIYGQGILITIDYFSQPVPSGYGTSLTVWQSGARYYGTPIMCETANAC